MSPTIISTIETDISAFLGGEPAQIVAQVKDFFSELLNGSLIKTFEYKIIPHDVDAAALTFFIQASAKLELVLDQLVAGPLRDAIASEKAIIDTAIATKAGSECIKAFGALVSNGEALFASPVAPTPEAAVSPSTKAVVIKAAVVSAPPPVVLTAAEWAMIQAQRAQATQTTVNAAADAPLIPLESETSEAPTDAPAPTF